MSTRRHIFFDLDHTLWDFERNASETIAELIAEYRHHMDTEVDAEHFYGIYSRINRKLWDAYERKEIAFEVLRRNRWEQAFAEVDVRPGPWMSSFNEEYVARCPHKPHVMDGAHELLAGLHGHYRLGIISNGISANQHVKLSKSGLDRYLDDVVTLDMAGQVPKPDPAIFRLALERAGAQARDCVYVGDTYLADVVGALGVGMGAIFFNPEGQPNPLGVAEVAHLLQVPTVLGGAWVSG